MKKYRTTYELDDSLFIKRDNSCDEGIVEAITLSVTPNNRVTEEYLIRCTDQLRLTDVTHVGYTKEEIIEKLIRVQVENLLSKPLRLVRDMVTDFITANVVGNHDDSKVITIFPRLHKRGFVISSDQITLVNFKKVEYTKTKSGIDVKFYHDNDKIKGGFATEAYATIGEASKRLRQSFLSKLEYDCSLRVD